MGRLIDADALIKGRVENDPVVIAVKCAPTAYDPDEVVAELKKESESSCGMYTARCPYIGETIFCEQCAMLRAIQIVKGGGVDGEIDKMD